MFRGLYEHSIDEKGRISLPAKLRELFSVYGEDRLIITTHISDPCLVVYPIAEWQALEQRIATKSQFDPRVTRLKRRFIAPAAECSLDKHGRIIIPAVLREEKKLTKDAIWAGMIDQLELWDKETWQQYREQSRDYVMENAEEIGRDLADLGI